MRDFIDLNGPCRWPKMTVEQRITEICRDYDVGLSEVCGPGQARNIVACRQAICRDLYAFGLSVRRIAWIINKDRAAVYYHLRSQCGRAA